MPGIVVAGRRYEVDAVVFDKDGTLVDFERIWGPRTTQWAQQVAALAGAPQLAEALYRAVGYDTESAAIMPDGPMAVASLSDIFAIAASVLFQHGIEWHDGYPLAVRAAQGTLALAPTAAEVQGRGDVAGTVRRLAAAGIAVGVATNDERALTEVALQQLGVAEMVSAMVCGDDAMLPKPDPAGLHWLASQLGTTAARLAMVGDSGTDMLAGRNAGVAVCIGVSGGAGRRETLARFADVVVEEVGEIVIDGVSIHQ